MPTLAPLEIGFPAVFLSVLSRTVKSGHLVPAVMVFVLMILLYLSSVKRKFYPFHYDVHSITTDSTEKGKHIVKNFHYRTPHVL